MTQLVCVDRSVWELKGDLLKRHWHLGAAGRAEQPHWFNPTVLRHGAPPLRLGTQTGAAAGVDPSPCDCNLNFSAWRHERELQRHWHPGPLLATTHVTEWMVCSKISFLAEELHMNSGLTGSLSELGLNWLRVIIGDSIKIFYWVNRQSKLYRAFVSSIHALGLDSAFNLQ
jgi:hypothetical protein